MNRVIRSQLAIIRACLRRSTYSGHHGKDGQTGVDTGMDDGISLQHTTAAQAENEKFVYEPIKYTESKAHKEYRSWMTFRMDEQQEFEWKIKRRILKGALAVFMIYFFILREENDIDVELNMPLFERLPHLEEPMLKSALINSKKHGQPTADIEKRLTEIARLNK